MPGYGTQGTDHTETLEEYVRKRCNEIDARYNLEEADIRTQTNKKSFTEKEKMEKRLKPIEVIEAFTIIIAEVVTFFSTGEALNKMSNRNDGGDTYKILLLVIGICVLEYFVIRFFFRSISKQVKNNVQVKMNSMMQESGDMIQQLTMKKNAEKKALEAEINAEMNQYVRKYEQSAACVFIGNWILNVFSNAVAKADRSSWLPQVKVSVRFVVHYNYIEVPGYGRYDMAAQGIQIDNNPMSVGALAYVLENKALAEARMRFQHDPNGGKPVVSSTRNDTHVELLYSAPNGGGIVLP